MVDQGPGIRQGMGIYFNISGKVSSNDVKKAFLEPLISGGIVLREKIWNEHDFELRISWLTYEIIRYVLFSSFAMILLLGTA